MQRGVATVVAAKLAVAVTMTQLGDTMVAPCSKSILRSRSGLQDSNKPIGSFLLLGQTGTGKTYTSKIISESVFGGKDKIEIGLGVGSRRSPN